MRNKLQLVLIAALVLALTGCFGLINKEGKLEQLQLKADNLVVEPGDTVTLTVVGKDEKGRNVIIEPTTDSWSWTPEDAGVLEVDPQDPTKAEFTADENYIGEVTVKVVYEELEVELSITIEPIEILGVIAYKDLEEQDGYLESPNSDDHQGVKPAPETDSRGYAYETVFTHWNWPGHWLKWKINVPKAGEYALVLRYATKESSPHTDRTLKINGEEIYGPDNPIVLPSTGDFGKDPSQWGIKVVPVNIKTAGEIELVLTHAGPPGERKGVNLAYIALVSPANVTIDDAFVLRIEQVLGVQRVEGFWQ